MGGVSQYALGQTPPGQTPPSPPTVTAADDTHPTGMHSCYWMQMNCVRNCNYSVFTVFKVLHPHCGPQPHDILTGVWVQHPATFTHNTQHQKTQSRIHCTEQMPTPGENLKCQKSHRYNQFKSCCNTGSLRSTSIVCELQYLRQWLNQ